ncbi:hypothetical protein [Nocardioides marmoraquaticus]
MAKPAAWSAAEWEAWKQQQALPTVIDSQVAVLDLDMRPLLTVPREGFAEGQWNLVGGGDVDRTFQGVLVDTDGAQLGDHLDDAVAPRRLIQVRQGAYVQSLGRWLWTETFTGRPQKVSDDSGGVWKLEAHDGAVFHDRGVPANAFRKNRYVVDEIRAYLESTGEPRIDIPSRSVITKRLSGDIAFGGESDALTPLAAMRRAASLAGCQLFWTGANVATMRPWPIDSAPLWHFTAEQLLSEPQWSTDLATLRNGWVGGGKNSLRGSTTATSGAYTPEQLARGGRAWTNYEFGDDDESLATATALAARGESRIAALVTLSTAVTVELLPFWALDPLDVVRVSSPYRSEVVKVRDCSVPVAGQWSTAGTAAAGMSFGSLRNKRSGAAGRVAVSGSARPAKKKSSKSKGKGRRR